MPKRIREKTDEPEKVVQDYAELDGQESVNESNGEGGVVSVANTLSKEALEAFNAAERAKGVVYLGRVPPGMKPAKIRHLLSRYGEIGRLYLAPEDPAVFRRRVTSGGSRKLQFVEGWVEFLDKHIARATALTIHNTAMGDAAVGKAKRDFFSSELWNVKYLKHFKWHHLTEKVAYERRIRAMKLRTQMAKAKKEAEAYLVRVDQAKGIEAMKARRREAQADVDDAPRRQFKQISAILGEGGE